PNSIYTSTAGGTNRLIQEGAFLVTNPMQIINDTISLEKIINRKKLVRNGETKDNRNTLNNKIKADNRNTLNNKIKADNRNTLNNKTKADNKNDNNDKKDENNANNESNINIMSKEYLEIYKILTDEPIHINEISKRAEKPVYEVSSIV